MSRSSIRSGRIPTTSGGTASDHQQQSVPRRVSSHQLSFVHRRNDAAGDGKKLKAYTIAVEALGRGTDFDPQTDPIVRVEAVRLRQALARYYSGTGRDDPLVIEVPRGSYVPAFRRRHACEGQKPRARLRFRPAREPKRARGHRRQRRELSQSISGFASSSRPTGDRWPRWRRLSGKRGGCSSTRARSWKPANGSTLLAALISRCYQPRSPISRMKSGLRMSEKRKDNKAQGPAAARLRRPRPN